MTTHQSLSLFIRQFK